jgi:type IV pilus assembly protein PilQ
VAGRITLRLKNVPWDQAMDIILKTKGLSMRRNDNVVLVAPTEEIAAREKLELESQQQIEELAPLRSELIQVNYAKAEDLASLLKSPENKLISDRGSVSIDERTNTLLIQDTAAKISEVRELVATLDIPVRQVLIESRIVIANNDFARDLGVKLSGATTWTNGDTNIGIGGGLDNEPPTGTAPIFDPGGLGEALLVNLPAVAPTSAANFVVGKLGSWLLRLELSAMQMEGKGEIVSSPRVITADQNQATIKQGVQIPYQEATSSGATSVAFKDAVLELTVTPQITPDDRIIMDLNVKKDNPDFTRAILGVPPVDTREVETSVLVDNGETVVLGGVFERNKSKNIGRTPFFGDLPYVGWAFRQETVNDENSELLIFVTPKILKDTLTLR